jgi:hypothetical protein
MFCRNWAGTLGIGKMPIQFGNEAIQILEIREIK